MLRSLLLVATFNASRRDEPGAMRSRKRSAARGVISGCGALRSTCDFIHRIAPG